MVNRKLCEASPQEKTQNSFLLSGDDVISSHASGHESSTARDRGLIRVSLLYGCWSVRLLRDLLRSLHFQLSSQPRLCYSKEGGGLALGAQLLVQLQLSDFALPSRVAFVAEIM